LGIYIKNSIRNGLGQSGSGLSDYLVTERLFMKS
jgi:hypothetical protein